MHVRSFGSGKAVGINYSECMSVALVIQQAKRVRCVTALCGITDPTVFLHIMSKNGKIWGEILLNTKCVS